MLDLDKIYTILETNVFEVARLLEVVSGTFCRFMIIEISFHAYFAYFLDIMA